MLKTTFESAALRRLLVGSAGAYLGLWAFTVLFAIYAYDEGGAAAVGVALLLRQLPAGLLAPWISVFADRHPRRKVLLVSGAVQTVLMAAVGGLVAFDGPYAAVVALAAVLTVAAAPFRPAQFALIPQLAGTPAQIAAANVVWGAVEYAGFLGGSLAAAGLVASLSLTGALSLCAAPIALGTLVLATLPKLPESRDEGETASAWAELSAGIRTVLANAEMRLLTGFRGADALVQGCVDVLLVACALELLDTGQSGVGVLSGAWGVGGVVGGWLGLSLLRRGRLASGVGLGSLLSGVPLVLIAVWAAPVPAIAFLVVLGVGFAVLEAALNTLLQRQAADTVLARVFGVNEGVYVLGTALGGLVAAGLLSALDVEGALVATGLALPVLALALRRRLSRMEAGIEVPERAFTLLRALDMFAPLPIATMEVLASRSTFEDLPPGHVLMRQGDVGDKFYVVDEGHLDVFVDGRHVDEREPGSALGEIALLRDRPRMATVKSAGHARVLTLGRQEFLSAIGSHERSSRAADRLAEERGAWAASQLARESH